MPQSISSRGPEQRVVSDSELLIRFCENKDEQAFEALLERHKVMVSAVCTSVLGQRADVEDAFQSTFFRLAEKARTVRERDNLAAWLHRVALRCSVTLLRRRRRDQIGAPLMDDDATRASLSDVAKRAEYSALHEALDALPAKYRLPLLLFYFENLTCAEAAQRLNVSEAAMHKRLQRARCALRRRLAVLGVAGLSLAMLNSGAASAHAVSISTQQLSAISSVACQIKLAWSGGLIASAGQQASHVLSQGVIKTMFATAFVKTTVALFTCACVGLFVLTVVAPAQTPTDTHLPGNHLALLPTSDAPSQDEPEELFRVRIEGYVISGKIHLSRKSQHTSNEDLAATIGGVSMLGFGTVSDAEQDATDEDNSGNPGVIRIGPGLYRLIEQEPEGISAYVNGRLLRGLEFSEKAQDDSPQDDPFDISVFSFYLGFLR